MKKITILSIVFIAISLASCSHKDRICTCTEIDNVAGATPSEFTIVYKNTTNKNATGACMSLEVTPDGQSVTTKRTCTLK